MPNAEKIESVARYKKMFEEADSLFVTDYRGLSVADMTVLRRNLKANNAQLLIAKNTLLNLAAKEAGVEGLEEHFKGPTAVAFAGEDPAPVAKILNDSFKDKELPRMKVFIVDREQFEGSEIGRLADLPPRDILLSMVVASVEAPFTELVGTLDGFFRNLIGVVDALAEKKQNEG